MALDWRELAESNVGDLITRRRYAKAIEVLRSQLEGRAVPSVQTRLQLVDLLLLAGRGKEAVPILLGLADEFATDGFVAKAVAILKRVEKAEPGRPDVQSRLASLAGQQLKAAPSVVGVPAPSRSQPQFGIEEIDASFPAAMEQAATVDTAELMAVVGVVAEPSTTVERATTVETEEVTPPEMPIAPAAESETAVSVEASTPAAEAAAESASETVGNATPVTVDEATAAPAGSEPEVVVEAQATGSIEAPAPPVGEATPAPATEGEGAGAAGPSTKGVTGRIRGVFRRFLASLTEREEGDEGATPPAEVAPETEAPLTEGSAGPTPAATETTAPGKPIPEAQAAATPESMEPSPPAAPPEETAATEALAAPPAMNLSSFPDALVAGPGEAAAGEEPMSEEVFQDKLLDLVEDVLHRPASAPAAPASPVGGFELQLMASPLLGDLSQDELLAVMQGLRLHTCQAGDVVVSEGEAGDSLFILASGAVRVFVRNPAGRNFEVDRLTEGEFFGEISLMSGRPRTATIVAATPCELLELDKQTLESITRAHPRVAATLEKIYIQRASNPEAVAVRAIALTGSDKAIEVLEAHFGQSRWDPRMRLRLADVLLKAGKDDEAVPILIGLADELAHQGYPEKAVAILKKIERIRHRHLEEVNLAPLKGKKKKAKSAPAPAGALPASRPPSAPDKDSTRSSPRLKAAAKQAAREKTDAVFQGWLMDVVREAAERQKPAESGGDTGLGSREAARAYGPALKASPLFEGFTDDELLAFIRGLRLLTFEPGEIVLSEGEPGESLFILASGTVKVFVRNARGGSALLNELHHGTFFGEMAALSGRPRSATVIAAAPCELLELDRPTLDSISAAHPRVREVIEELYIERAASPEAARIRTAAAGPEASA